MSRYDVATSSDKTRAVDLLQPLDGNAPISFLFIDFFLLANFLKTPFTCGWKPGYRLSRRPCVNSPHLPPWCPPPALRSRVPLRHGGRVEGSCESDPIPVFGPSRSLSGSALANPARRFSTILLPPRLAPALAWPPGIRGGVEAQTPRSGMSLLVQMTL